MFELLEVLFSEPLTSERFDKSIPTTQQLRHLRSMRPSKRDKLFLNVSQLIFKVLAQLMLINT